MAGSTSLADFAALTLGGTYGNPEPTLERNKGSYQGQCVSLERQALSAIDGVNWGPIGDAVDYASPANQKKYASIGYTWKPGDTNFKDGDILVWGDDPGTWTGPPGHIARWYKGKLLNQNNGGNLKVTQNNFFSQGYLGRYTKGDIVKPTPQEIEAFINYEQYETFGKVLPLEVTDSWRGLLNQDYIKGTLKIKESNNTSPDALKNKSVSGDTYKKVEVYIKEEKK